MDKEGCARRLCWPFGVRAINLKSIQEIPQNAMDAITWYLAASGRDQNIQPGDPLFTSVVGGKERPLSASTIAKRIHHYAELAGLRASLHTLRHSSAKLRYESGSDARTIQHLLRHQNLSTTDLYLRTLVGTEDPGSHLLEEKLLERGLDFF